MSILQVKNYFAEYGLQDKIIEFDSSSATVQLAAQVLNTQPGRIAKTLSFDLDGKTILVVLAGDVKVNNALYKAEPVRKQVCTFFHYHSEKTPLLRQSAPS